MYIWVYYRVFYWYIEMKNFNSICFSYHIVYTILQETYDKFQTVRISGIKNRGTEKFEIADTKNDTQGKRNWENLLLTVDTYIRRNNPKTFALWLISLKFSAVSYKTALLSKNNRNRHLSGFVTDNKHIYPVESLKISLSSQETTERHEGSKIVLSKYR